MFFKMSFHIGTKGSTSGNSPFGGFLRGRMFFISLEAKLSWSLQACSDSRLLITTRRQSRRLAGLTTALRCGGSRAG